MEQSLTETAYAYIRERILNLTYAPGEPLTEAALARELDMSRMPVRTAVKQLQQEGLIQGAYRKKMRVKAITPEDVREIYQLRELLEGNALKLIFESGQHLEYSFRLEEKLVRMQAATDFFLWEQADAAMHMELLNIYDNERIKRICQMNQNEIIRIGILSSNSNPEVTALNDEIRRLVEFLRGNNYSAAYKVLLEEHLGQSCQRALERITATSR